jgi:hypothetical protein
MQINDSDFYEDDEMLPFKRPTRNHNDEPDVKYYHITSNTTLRHLITFLKQRFKFADIRKAVWGKEHVHLQHDKELVSQILKELKGRTNELFNKCDTFIATFNSIGYEWPFLIFKFDFL